MKRKIGEREKKGVWDRNADLAVQIRSHVGRFRKGMISLWRENAVPFLSTKCSPSKIPRYCLIISGNVEIENFPGRKEKVRKILLHESRVARTYIHVGDGGEARDSLSEEAIKLVTDTNDGPA